jgi:hypothetical protein
MSYQLILAERPVEGEITRDIGENVFLADLPADYKVYAFYYGGAMGNETLEGRLRALGGITGKNLFVNLGRLDDPKFDEIQKRFEIQKFPVVIVTAIGALASPVGEYVTAFARLDSKSLLGSPERTIECVQELFNLFLQENVSEAMSHAKWEQRKELLNGLTSFFAGALKSLKDFIFERDISISVLQGKFELKKHGG